MIVYVWFVSLGNILRASYIICTSLIMVKCCALSVCKMASTETFLTSWHCAFDKVAKIFPELLRRPLYIKPRRA